VLHQAAIPSFSPFPLVPNPVPGNLNTLMSTVCNVLVRRGDAQVKRVVYASSSNPGMVITPTLPERESMNPGSEFSFTALPNIEGWSLLMQELHCTWYGSWNREVCG